MFNGLDKACERLRVISDYNSDKLITDSKLYESVIDNNVWSPDGHAAGWRLVL